MRMLLTPLPRAYPGDPLVVRTINVSPTLDTLRFTGQRFAIDNRMTLGGDGKVQGDPGNGSPTAIGTVPVTLRINGATHRVRIDPRAEWTQIFDNCRAVLVGGAVIHAKVE